MVIVSRYKEDVSWIKDYSFDYIIYNKGPALEGYNSIDVENIGNNQRDIFHYIYTNYDNLPDTMAFIQGNPFDHCKREKFDKIINNNYLTAIESFEDLPDSSASRYRDGYEEINNSWYISAHNGTHNQTCKWSSFGDFMYNTFDNYTHSSWIRFTPGSQYIITKDIALHYPKLFWKYLMDILYKNNMTEGHIIERSLWMILQCNLNQTIC